jgi:8-oxo-dGTP pyrophosphatase MutT (NUDIX family)
MIKIDASWYKKPTGRISVRLAAGGIVARKEEDTIFVALITEGRFAEFSLPKGGVNPGESLEDAARREIHEEAGISRLDCIEYIGKRERMNITKRKWITVHYFLFTTEQKKGTPTDREKHHELKWFPLDELPAMLWPEQKRLIVRTKGRIKELLTKN